MRELPSLAESDRKIALDRYRLLQPHLEDGRTLSVVASEAGVAYSTAQRWVSLYRRFGLSALVRKRRSDRGQRRALSVKLRQVVEALALEKPPLPIAALHRQICKIAHETDQNIPTYKAVYRIVRELPKDLLVLAHEGTKAYAEAFDLIHRREADRPNGMWQADHTLLDILLVRDATKPAAKPWLTVVSDA
jgi:putative transposase